MTQFGVRDATGRFTETFEIFAHLSSPGSLTPVTVRHAMTVADLKSMIELVCGIPTDLQVLSYRHHAALIDGDTLGSLCLLPGSRLPIKIMYGYDGLVDATLRGDLKEVLMRIAATKESTGMARRRFVAMFVAAQRGYHYLVDRMLCEGANPDSQTTSGRTALHVACAMGNSGCLDSLLQHGASLNLKDTYGKTPTDIAVSCGQQGAQRRLILYSRILANKVSGKRPCDWPTSPRFPKSKLGSSITPTLALQELAISPGPQLMITNWKGQEHHHNFFEKRPRSTKSSLFQSNSSTSSTESWSSLKARDVQRDQHNLTTSDSSGVSKPELREEAPIYCSVPLHHHPKSSRSLKSVKFEVEKSLAFPSSMSKYSSNSGSGATKPDFHRLSAQTLSSSLSGATVSHGQFDDCHGKSGQCEATPAKHRHQERFSQEGNKAENRVQNGSRNPQCIDQADYCPLNQTGSDSLSSDGDNKSVQEFNLKEANDLKINHLNDKLRALIGLQVEHPQCLESMKEGQEMPTGSSSPAKRRKPTPEENEHAFKEWLASKTQDARDQRLVNRVGKMLEDAFGKKDETLIVDDDEDRGQKRKPLQFEAWSEKKAKQERVQSARLAARMTKQEQGKKEQLEARLSISRTMVDNWLAEKIKKQKQERLAEKQRESESQQLKTEREKAAQDVFKKWCLQKQWEELQMLKGRPNSGYKKSHPKSGNITKVTATGTSVSSRRTRAHSAPPRRQTVHSV